MSNLQSSPQPSSWQKGSFKFNDKSPKQVKLKVTFFVTPWISSKLNHNGKGHVLPTVIKIHVCGTSIVKVTFNRNSGERLAPDTHFTAASLKKKQLVLNRLILLAFPPRHLPNTVTAGSYSKFMWQATRESISGSQQCLVLVGWVELYFLE